MTRYTLRPDRAVLVLRGLLDTVLYAAQTAVVVGGVVPRTVLRTLEHAILVLKAHGYNTGDRHRVVGQRTATERDLVPALKKELKR